jgi:hypothetical protein
MQGKTVLQQFLRVKAAAQLADGGGKGVVEGLRARLALGEAVEVAGYMLNPTLARELEASTLTPPTAHNVATRVVWLEVSNTDEPALSPAAATALQGWRQAGWSVTASAVRGPAFWQTTEIEDAPALVTATVSMLRGAP